MTQPGLAAGADLFTPCISDPIQWLSAIDGWRTIARRLRLRVVVTPGYWERLGACGCGPTYERTRQALGRAGLGDSVQMAMAIVAALQTSTETMPWEGVLTDWSASGCLGSKVARDLAEEIIAAARLLPSGARFVAGAGARDDEAIRLEGIESDGLSMLSETITVTCHPRADTYVGSLDPLDFIHEPELAIEIACARLQPIVAADLSRYQVLPEFSTSLAAMDANMKRRTIETMAHLLLPKGQRPSGLEEHAVRTGPGANAPSYRSRRGVLLRVDLSKHGTGWRLHLWRGEDGVSFSHVTTKKAPLVVYE